MNKCVFVFDAPRSLSPKNQIGVISDLIYAGRKPILTFGRCVKRAVMTSLSAPLLPQCAVRVAENEMLAVGRS